MNSRQFGFYATGTDMQCITRQIESLGVPFSILEKRKKFASPTFASDLSSEQDLTSALVRRDDLSELRWTPLSNGEELLNVATSPVIEVNRPYFDGRAMSRGRLYYSTKYYDGNRKPSLKPAAFLDWASTVFRVVKKCLAYDKGLTPYAGDYVADNARAWIDALNAYDVSPTGRITEAGKAL
jgi:hypothetical protein